MSNHSKIVFVATICLFMMGISSSVVKAQEIPNPVFSNPTKVDNPICPKSTMSHLVMVGDEGGLSLRTEESLLPMTRDIEWGGGTIKAIVTYFVGFKGGKLVETAFDYYAQDDTGTVWYLGEDVTNYENGKWLNNDGTWLAGHFGAPPAVFMPPNPQLGAIWHPENRPGLVLEQNTVLSITEKVNTPHGMVDNGMRIQEDLMDGSVEFKTWATGYCDVMIEASDEHAKTVLTNYTTDTHRVVPNPLVKIEGSAEAIFDGVSKLDWKIIQQETQNIHDAWGQYTAESQVETNMPIAFRDAMDKALSALQSAIDSQNAPGVQAAANAITFAASDLFSYYIPVVPADLARLDALERQVLVDLGANDLTSATDTLAQTSAIWVRLRPFVLGIGGTAESLAFETSLNAQLAATATQDTAIITSEVTKALEAVDALEKLF